MKKMSSFRTQKAFLDYRIREVKKSLSLNFDDAWATDKNWAKKALNGFFSCKFCGKPMYQYDYSPGTIHVGCKTPLCPGNPDSGMANQIKEHQFDIRELTNQYFFNSKLQF
ncbi:MAG: hypothetical protein ACTSYF_08750 [Promethearchaeota archaeon]